MNELTITITIFLSIMLLLTTGLPVMFIMGAVGGIFSLLLWGPGGLSMLIFPTFGLMQTFILAAVPFFILMGVLLQRSGIADSLFKMMHIWSGSLRGGMAVGVVIVCAIFAAMVGVSGAATVAMGIIALPAMLTRNYSKYLATGTIQAGGALGLLIPPSIPFLNYAFLTQQSAGKMFAAGIVPGLLLCVLFISYILIRSYLQPDIAPAPAKEELASWPEKFEALKALILPGFLITGVMLFILLGVTTVTEASIVGAVGAIIATAIKGKLTWKLMHQSLEQTTRITGMVMWICLAAMCFGSIYTGLGAPKLIESALEMAGLGPWGILICMQLSFFFLGMFLDNTAILFLTIPLYFPIITRLGFDPIWFGVCFVMNMEMAFLTPPFGMNLFYMKGIVPKTITMLDLYKSVIPFVILQAIGLMIVMMFPQLATWLPNLLFG